MTTNYSVYVKTNCPFCKKAVSLLEEKNIPFIVIVVDKNEEFLEEIKRQTNHQTIPIILEHTKNGTKFIGGSDDLENYLNLPEFING